MRIRIHEAKLYGSGLNSPEIQVWWEKERTPILATVLVKFKAIFILKIYTFQIIYELNAGAKIISHSHDYHRFVISVNVFFFSCFCQVYEF